MKEKIILIIVLGIVGIFMTSVWIILLPILLITEIRLDKIIKEGMK